MMEPAVSCACEVEGTLVDPRRVACWRDPDNVDADVTLLRCSGCGRPWVSYFLEYTYFSGDDRIAWYRGLLTEQQAREVTGENGCGVVEALPWYWAGGSHFSGRLHRRSGPISDPG